MKYYSDKTKKVYNEVADLESAEKAYDDAHAEELKEKESAKRDAEEIKKTYEELAALRKKYCALVDAFVRDHKSYRLTISTRDYFDNLFDWLF